MNLFLKCIIAVASSATQSLGLTLQRASYLGLHDATGHSNVHIWRVGVGLFVMANLLGSTVQLALLPLVLVCTLQAAGLVANSLFAWLLLREPLTRAATAGTCLIITGAVVVAAFGGVSQADPDLSLDKLVTLLHAKRFVLYMAFTVAILLTCVYRAQRASHLRSSIRGVLLGLAAGILSAHSLLMAKVVISLLVRDVTTIFRDLARLQFWVPPVLFLTFALGQMWCVNSGLQRISTSVFYPLIFCVYNVVTLLNGFAFYGKKSMFAPEHLGYVVLGSAILILGVGLLSSRLDDEGAATCPADAEQGSVLNTAIGSPASSIRPTTFQDSASQLSASAPNAGQPDPPISPSQVRPPLVNKRSADAPLLDASAGPQYTSFESLNPNISNPDKSRSRHSGRLGRHNRGRVLSKEQQDILRELYM